MTIFYFVLKRFFRSSSNILLLFLPLAVVFIPSPTEEWLFFPLGFQYYGIILLFLAARVSTVIMEDRVNRTLLRISVAPVTHFQYLWQNMLAFSLLLTGLNLLMIVAGIVVHGAGLVNPLLLFLLYTVFTMTALGFSLAWFSLFHSKDAAFSILSGVVMIMAILGGIFVPVEALPGVLQRTAMFFPTYWLAEGMKLISGGASLRGLLLPLAILVMFTTAFLLLGSRRRLA